MGVAVFAVGGRWPKSGRDDRVGLCRPSQGVPNSERLFGFPIRPRLAGFGPYHTELSYREAGDEQRLE